MSITFCVIGSPTRMTQDRDYDGRLMFEPDGTPVMVNEDVLPSMNLSGLNAGLLMDMIGLAYDESESCGEITKEELPEVRRRILAALNTDMKPWERPSSESRGQMRKVEEEGNVATVSRGCRVHTSGIDSHGIRLRLESLLRIVIAAQENDLTVGFA